MSLRSMVTAFAVATIMAATGAASAAVPDTGSLVAAPIPLAANTGSVQVADNGWNWGWLKRLRSARYADSCDNPWRGWRRHIQCAPTDVFTEDVAPETPVIVISDEESVESIVEPVVEIVFDPVDEPAVIPASIIIDGEICGEIECFE